MYWLKCITACHVMYLFVSAPPLGPPQHCHSFAQGLCPIAITVFVVVVAIHWDDEVVVIVLYNFRSCSTPIACLQFTLCGHY